MESASESNNVAANSQFSAVAESKRKASVDLSPFDLAPGFAAHKSYKSATIDGSSGFQKWVNFNGTPSIAQKSASVPRSVKIPSPFYRPSLECIDSPVSPPITDRNQWISFDSEGQIRDKNVIKKSSDSADSWEHVSCENSSPVSCDVNGKSALEVSLPNKREHSSEEEQQELSLSRKTLPALLPGGGKGGDDTRALFKSSSDSESELSDEIVDLDYESDETKKLRDTPVKKYPEVSLFLAKSAVDGKPAVERKKISAASTTSSNKKLELTPISDESDDVDDLDDYPDCDDTVCWDFLCRYPHQKKVFGSRKWVPVKVSLVDDFVKLSGNVNGNDISREVPLHPFFVFTVPVLHRGDGGDKVVAIKMQYVKYLEKRKFRRRVHFEHTPIYSPVLKLASSNFLDVKAFIRKAENIIRKIPTHRDKGIVYRHEEIFIDCDDSCEFLVSGKGDVLKSNISMQMRVRAFVSGHPELRMHLNDIRYKSKPGRSRDSVCLDMPSTIWMDPAQCEYHECVDQLSSDQEGTLLFTPPDGCSFELLRYRLYNRKPLPVVVKCSVNILSSNSIKIDASVQATGDARSLRRRRNNAVLYIPIPDSWARLFFKSKGLDGQKQYMCAKSKDGLSSASCRSSNISIDVSAGKAQYESAYGSLVWRLASLPLLSSKVAADGEHTLTCSMQLPFLVQVHDDFQPFCYFEFDIPHCVGSDVHVQELLLSNGGAPEKWVSYQANFFYKVCMQVIEFGQERPSLVSIPVGTDCT